MKKKTTEEQAKAYVERLKPETTSEAKSYFRAFWDKKHITTHYCCNARLKKEGGKARCCECVPHKNCESNITSEHNE